MRKFIIIVGISLTALSALLLFLSADRPSHDITFDELKSLHKGMTYKEVTNAIGLPDEVQPFAFATHLIACRHPNAFDFKPTAQTDIAQTINSIYADSIPCCEGMKESWINKLPIFLYENKREYFHHLKIYVHFSPSGNLNDFSFIDKGVLAKTDNGMIYSLNGKLWYDKGITPIYTDEEIEKIIRKI